MRHAVEIEAVAGMLREVTPETGAVTVFAAPTEAEQQLLHDAMGVDDHTIASVLDPEEISRLELGAWIDRSMGNGSGPAPGPPVPSTGTPASHVRAGAVARALDDRPVDAHH